MKSLWLLRLGARALLGLLPSRVFITHTDLDGVVSYVVLKKRVGDGLLLFSNPRSIHQVLKLLSLASNRELYVTDIGVNDSNREAVRRALSRMVSKGWKVTWIDHHRWPEVDVPGVNFIVRPAPSAAQLVYEEFNGNDTVVKLVEIANDADTATYSLEESRILSTACRGTKWLRRVAEVLSSGELITPDIKERAEDLMRRDEEKIAEALSRVRVLKTSSGREFAIIDFRPKGGPGSQASRQLVRERPVDFVLVLYNCSRFSLYKGEGGQDLSVICRRFNGGGHPYACGGRVNLSLLDRVLCWLGFRDWPIKKLLEEIINEY